MGQQKSVRQAEGLAGLNICEHLLVVFRHRGVGDEQQRNVASPDDLVHFTQRAVLLGEADRGCLGDRRRALPESDLDRDLGADERIPQVLRLRRSLRGPTNHPDLFYVLEGFWQQGKQITATGDDGLGWSLRD